MASLFELESKVQLHELRLGRIESDIESEKGTRARANSEIIVELKEVRASQIKSDRLIYIGIGVILALEFVIGVLVAIKWK